MTEQNPQDPVTPPPSATPPPPEPAPVGYEGGPAAATTQDERTWGMLAHISSLAGFVIPLGNVIGPLIVWLVKKDQMPFVNDQGKESLNFQITILIAALISGALICVGIGIVLLPVVAVVALVFAIIAGVKANQGEAYRYPFAIRLIK